MAFQIHEKWFEFRKVDDDITLIWEPYADPLIRCNIWHIKGRDQDLLVDTGLGLASLKDAAKILFDKPLLALATHTHYDHAGGLHEFENRIVHHSEAHLLETPGDFAGLYRHQMPASIVSCIEASGYSVPDVLVTAIPVAGFDPETYVVRPAPAQRTVSDGDVIDIGRRRFVVLHLPGHSPGSIGLWDAASGTLFSGDAIYDGPLLDHLPESNINHYIGTMQRLLNLPVRVVHAGHDPSFGAERLREIALGFLKLHDAV
ncbi:MAG: MBL fold metallo-hydrolase [Parvibaculaceae bacterium]